jgi:L-malate glycosyltransferase
MDTTLRIAHCVESYAPAKGGMPEVVRQLSERMAKKGHRVTVFTSAHPQRKENTINGVAIRSFSITGNKVNGISGDTQAYFDALRNGKFDVVVFFAAQQWATDAVIEQLDEIPGKKVFVPTGFSHFYNPAYKAYYEGMKTWMRGFDMNVFLSDDYTDINFARENRIDKQVLIPNGAAAEEFEKLSASSMRIKLGVKKEELMILHVGTYTGVKGHREALNIFIRSSVRNATLVLIGDKISYLEKAFRTHYSYWLLRLRQIISGKKVIFAELTREETVEAFREADLFLFPSNVECSPIVLFESMAAGIPFLASGAGNTEEIIQWTNAGWLLPGTKAENGWVKVDVENSIRKLEEVVADRRAMEAKGKAGHAAWKQDYTWATIADRYIELYQQLISQS